DRQRLSGAAGGSVLDERLSRPSAAGAGVCNQRRGRPPAHRPEPEVAVMSLLEIDDLSTAFDTAAGTIRAVDGVSLTLEPGQITGLVGESGSGKSITGFSVLGLLDPPGRI